MGLLKYMERITAVNFWTGGQQDMRIVINISGWDPARQKEIVKSIRGFVKALAKRLSFQVEFERMG